MKTVLKSPWLLALWAFIPLIFFQNCSGSSLKSSASSLGSDLVGAPPPTGDYAPGLGPDTATALRQVSVRTVAELTAAISSAQPGDAIVLEDGVYRINDKVSVTRSGTPAHWIFLTAKNPGAATIEHCNIEGFRVSGAYWVFENLEIRGACPTGGAQNAHAFHIVGAAHGIIVRLSTIVDFQSHVKLNGESVGGVLTWPNEASFLGNIWKDTAPMPGTDPKNVLNLDGGLRHVIRGNVFVDFATARSDQHQSAIYPKATANDAVIEQNLVVCSKRVSSGNSIRAIYPGDQTGSGGICNGSCTNLNNIYRNNIVMNCQGAGNSGGLIVFNESNAFYAHNTIHNVKHNFYYATTPGPNYFMGNLLYKPWAFGGAARPTEDLNLMPDLLGMNAIFANPGIADFSLKDGATLRAKVPRDNRAPHDFCGNLRAPTTDIGAIDYSHPGAAACVEFIRDLYDRI